MERNSTTRAYNSSFYDSNQSSESESLFSFENEICKKKNFVSKNFDQFKMISSIITSPYDQIAGEKKSTEVCSHYFNEPLQMRSEHDKIDALKVKYHMEEVKMKRSIRDLEKKLNEILSRNQIITNEVSSIRKKREATEEALGIAKNYYSTVWDMSIHIDSSTEDRFTCVVNFKFAYGMYPIRFVIARNSRQILEWDGSSLLSPEEENEMKDRFFGIEHYFPKILSELRLLALNKINSS